MIRRPPRSTRTDTLFPYTTLFRSAVDRRPWTVDYLHSQRDSLFSGKSNFVNPMEYSRRKFLRTTGQTVAGAGLLSALPWDVIARDKARISSEERRVGKECVSKCRYRWSTDHTKKKQQLENTKQ